MVCACSIGLLRVQVIMCGAVSNMYVQTYTPTYIDSQNNSSAKIFLIPLYTPAENMVLVPHILLVLGNVN